MISIAGNNESSQTQTPLLFRRNNILNQNASLPLQLEHHQRESIQFPHFPLNCEERLPPFNPLVDCRRSVEAAEEYISILLCKHQMEIQALQQIRSQNLKDLQKAHSLLNHFSPNFHQSTERFALGVDPNHNPADIVYPQSHFPQEFGNSLFFPRCLSNNNVYQNNTPMISYDKQDHQQTQDIIRNNQNYIQYFQEQQWLQEQQANQLSLQVKQEAQQADQQQDNSSTRETAMTIKVEHLPELVKNHNISPSLKCQNTETPCTVTSKAQILHSTTMIENSNRNNNNKPDLLEEFMAVHNMKTGQFQNKLTCGTITANNCNVSRINSIEIHLKKQLKTAKNERNICSFRPVSHSSSKSSSYFISQQDKSLTSMGHLLTYMYSFNQNGLFGKEDNLISKLFEIVGQQTSSSSSASSWDLSSVSRGLVNQNIKNLISSCSDSQGKISQEEDEDDVSSGVSFFIEPNHSSNVSQHTILTITEADTFPSAVSFEDTNTNDKENEKTNNLQMIQKQYNNSELWRKPSIDQMAEKNGCLQEQGGQIEDQRNNTKDPLSLLKKRRISSIDEGLKVLYFVDNLMQKDTKYSDTNQKPDKKCNQHQNKANHFNQNKQHSYPPLFQSDEILKQIQVSSVSDSNKELTQEVSKIVSQFKSNHKIYFKKIRSAKEMLKDTKFHNLNKRIMRVLLSILTLSRIEELNVHPAAMNFFKSMSSKLVQSAKKIIRDTLVNDQYSHAHYNTMFLRIDQSNYSQLQQSTADIELHGLIYQIDLKLPYCQTQFAIHKANIIKRYIYLILHNTLILNETQNDSEIEAIRSLYIKRVLKGMEKMQSGKIVQRF